MFSIGKGMGRIILVHLSMEHMLVIGGALE